MSSTFVLRDISYEIPFSWYPVRKQIDAFGRRVDSITQPLPQLDIYMPSWGESYGELVACNVDAAGEVKTSSSTTATTPDSTTTNQADQIARHQHSSPHHHHHHSHHQLSTSRPRRVRKLPVVVVVHGGGWHRGGRNVEWRGAPPISRALAPHGFITVAVSYRLSSPLAISMIVRCAFFATIIAGLVKLITLAFAPKLEFWKIFLVVFGAILTANLAFKSHPSQASAKHPDHVNDVARAITWVRHNISKVFPRPPADFPTVEVDSSVSPIENSEDNLEPEILVADPDAIYLVGHSAGAHLVSLVAIDPQYLHQADAQYRTNFPSDVYDSTSDASESRKPPTSIQLMPPAAEPSPTSVTSPTQVRLVDATSLASDGEPSGIDLVRLPSPKITTDIDSKKSDDTTESLRLITADSPRQGMESKEVTTTMPSRHSSPLSPLSPASSVASEALVTALHQAVDDAETAEEAQTQLDARSEHALQAKSETHSNQGTSSRPQSLLSFPIRGVLPISGIYDLLRPLRPWRYHPMNFMFNIFYTYSAFGYTDATKMGASPIHRLRELFPAGVYDALPPFTVLSAVSDFGLEFGAQAFVEELKAKHATVNYAVIDSTNHATIVSKFTTFGAYQTVLSSLQGTQITTVTVTQVGGTTTTTTTTTTETKMTTTTIGPNPQSPTLETIAAVAGSEVMDNAFTQPSSSTSLTEM